MADDVYVLIFRPYRVQGLEIPVYIRQKLSGHGSRKGPYKDYPPLPRKGDHIRFHICLGGGGTR